VIDLEENGTITNKGEGRECLQVEMLGNKQRKVKPLNADAKVD
jgi:hypothetical protein